MLKVCGKIQVVKPGEWKQRIEIFHEGHILGFIDREKKPQEDFVVRTRNIFGEIMEGECIDWLLHQMA
jgi:hypothetical protein